MVGGNRQNKYELVEVDNEGDEKEVELIDLGDAQHPSRQKAIRIIENVIEPFVERGIEGVEYYELEDRLTNIIDD